MLRDTGKLTNGISQLFPSIRMERAISVIQKKNPTDRADHCLSVSLFPCV